MKRNKLLSAVIAAVMAFSMITADVSNAVLTVSAATPAAVSSTQKSTQTAKVAKTTSGIKKICGLTATVETDESKCLVDVANSSNPYDVIWDYGKEYDKYVNACNWSLVFDAEYYKKTFPMLAVLYHDDSKLLLKHFQTVGIHEGRQGSANFNIGEYYHNCAKSVKKAFGKNYEGYYFYYMLNYSTQKNIKTASSTRPVIYRAKLTKHQKDEFTNIDKYRDEVKANTLYWNTELAAYANFRAYINVVEGWNSHDWAIKNSESFDGLLYKYANLIGAPSISENMIEEFSNNYSRLKAAVKTEGYYNSPSHYKAMVNTKFNYAAASNVYKYKNINDHKHNPVSYKYIAVQFDVFCAEANDK